VSTKNGCIFEYKDQPKDADLQAKLDAQKQQ
jgi:hypothetical protein